MLMSARQTPHLIKRAIRREQQNHRSRALLYNNQAAAAALFNHLISYN